MEEWKEYRLGDIIAIKSGFAYKGSMIGFGENVLLGMGSVSFKERFLLSGARPYAGDCADRYCAHVGDIVLATRQQSDNLPILGMPAIIPNELSEKKIIIGANLYRVDNESDFSNEYIYWLLKTPLYVNHIRSCQSGTTVRMITKANIEDFRFKAPGRKERDRISHFLKSLDDKIEVNRRINDNLEQQAQALFKSWFVDFEPFRDQPFVESELGMIPEGWRVVSLDEMTSKFGTGLNPRKNFKLGEGNNYYVTIKNMGNNRVYLDDKCDKVNDEAVEKINKRSKLQKGDLLFSGIGTIGRVALITETPTNWNTSESVFNLHPSEIVSSEFLYILLLSDVFQQYVKLHAQGGVQQGIRMASLKDYKMAIPKYSIIREFDNKIVPLVSLAKSNDDETDRLASLRDTLLPRLMSGELKVNEIENAI